MTTFNPGTGAKKAHSGAPPGGAAPAPAPGGEPRAGGGVEAPPRPEFLVQPLCRPEDAAAPPDVLSHEEDAVVARQFLLPRLPQGFDDSHLSHGGRPRRRPDRRPPT